MYDLHLGRDRFGEGADPGAAVGAVLEGAASVVNAITGAVTAGVSQQNEPQILTRNKSDLYATRLRQVRSLNASLERKESKLKGILKEIAKIRKDSRDLKKSLEKKLKKLPKWKTLMTIKKGKYKGKYKDPALAQSYINRIKSIDANGVMMSKDARHNHLMHGPDQRNRLREQIERNQNHKKREDLLAAWGYLTNISGFRPVLTLDMSGYGMSVLNVLPANDNLIGKRALTTVYPAFLNSAESRSAAAGRVPIFQRSTTLQTMLTMFGEGWIGTGVWPEAWLLGLTAEELEALPSPGAPLGAIYDIAMEAFPKHYFAKRMVVQDGLSVPQPSVSGDGYGGWGEQGVSFLDMTWNWDDTHQVETSYDPFGADFGPRYGAAQGGGLAALLQATQSGPPSMETAEALLRQRAQDPLSAYRSNDPYERRGAGRRLRPGWEDEFLRAGGSPFQIEELMAWEANRLRQWGDRYGHDTFGAVDRYGAAPATAFMSRVLQSIRRHRQGEDCGERGSGHYSGTDSRRGRSKHPLLQSPSR